MKTFAIALALAASALTLASQPSLAQTADTRAEVAPTMKVMGSTLKVLVSGLLKNEPVPNEELVAAARNLQGLTLEASRKAPGFMLSPTGALRQGEADELAQYDALMARLVGAANHLAVTLEAGNRAEATTILKVEVLGVQKQGHELFKHRL